MEEKENNQANGVKERKDSFRNSSENLGTGNDRFGTRKEQPVNEKRITQ